MFPIPDAVVRPSRSATRRRRYNLSDPATHGAYGLKWISVFMRKAVAIAVAGMLVAARGVGLAQGTSTYSFGPNTFSVALPAGFSLASNDGDTNYKLLSFGSPPRESGTRGVIQIMLWDPAKVGDMS